MLDLKSGDSEFKFCSNKLRVGFFPGSPWFNSSTALGHSHLVCLLPVGILNLLIIFQRFVLLTLKSPRRERSIKYPLLDPIFI